MFADGSTLSVAGAHDATAVDALVPVNDATPANVGGVVSAAVVSLFSTVFASSLPASSTACATKKYFFAGVSPPTTALVAPPAVVITGVVKFSPPALVPW